MAGQAQKLLLVVFAFLTLIADLINVVKTLAFFNDVLYDFTVASGNMSNAILFLLLNLYTKAEIQQAYLSSR